MSKNKLYKYAISLSTVSLLLLTNSVLFHPPAEARTARPRISFIERVKRFFFGTRPGGVAKGRTRGGAVRGPCRRIKDPLIALVPSTETGVPYVQKTISQRPTFWFYIPSLPVDELNAEFALVDEDGKDVYSGIFPLKTKPGIVSLQLPSDFNSLEPNKDYRWVFSAICNPVDRAADVIVNGWLNYTPNRGLNWKLRLTQGSDRVSISIDKGLWYETLTNLADLRQQNPQDEVIQADWAQVLQEMGLPKNAANNWEAYSLPPSANRTAR